MARRLDRDVFLDDANSVLRYAQLVEEESTMTVLAALRAVIEERACSVRYTVIEARATPENHS